MVSYFFILLNTKVQNRDSVTTFAGMSWLISSANAAYPFPFLYTRPVLFAYLFVRRTAFALLINHYQQLLCYALPSFYRINQTLPCHLCVCACEFIFRLKNAFRWLLIVCCRTAENKPQYNHVCCSCSCCCKLLGALNCRSFPSSRPT